MSFSDRQLLARLATVMLTIVPAGIVAAAALFNPVSGNAVRFAAFGVLSIVGLIYIAFSFERIYQWAGGRV